MSTAAHLTSADRAGLPRPARSGTRERRRAAPVLTVRGLSVRFGAIQALRDVDLDLWPGELVGLAGENGAGKSTLLRCVSGDISMISGSVWIESRPVERKRPAPPRVSLTDRWARWRREPAEQHQDAEIAVVWQNYALCDNLDVAANLMLGREQRWFEMWDSSAHHRARALLADLDIPITRTTQSVGTLSSGQRQMLAVARAMATRPRLLILDEPTASLSVRESAQVEELMVRLRMQGTTVLLLSHDIDQMLRLCERVVVLRQGRVVGSINPKRSHRDDLLALMAGYDADTSAHNQLSRLHTLTEQLAAAGPTFGLSLIMSTLGSAIGADQLSIHLAAGDRLGCAGSMGLPPKLRAAWDQVSANVTDHPVALAAARKELVVATQMGSNDYWRTHPQLCGGQPIAGSWSLPFGGATGPTGVITVFRRTPATPDHDEIELLRLYSSYVSSALERDELLRQLTARNRILESIRSVLQTLAGPGTIVYGLTVALDALRGGLRAREVALVGWDGGGQLCVHAVATDADDGLSDVALSLARELLTRPAHGTLRDDECRMLAVSFPDVGGPMVLLARGVDPLGTEDEVLLGDAAHSILLALERGRTEASRQEAAALRRSQEMERQFLARLSHDLRTPLTAIRGYASSLMQDDVAWDEQSHDRFLSRIESESARLRRLVDDLLDVSMIESGILRLQPDWCDLTLVLDAARACLPPAQAVQVEIHVAPDVPVIWADHDRLEQAALNLLENAVKHNVPGTSVRVVVGLESEEEVRISFEDNGFGPPPGVDMRSLEQVRERRSATAGAGLGLSIVRGIVSAHGGSIQMLARHPGTQVLVALPVEKKAPDLADD